MWRAVSLVMFVITVASLVVGSAAANTVPVSKGSDTTRAITPDTLKPVACAGITVTTILTGAGNIDPGGPDGVAQLILGGPAAQTIRGRGGNDCILGGGGDDNIRCDAGTDVAIGGAGAADTFNADCETQIQ